MTSALTDPLGDWLRRVSHAVSARLARRLFDPSVSAAEWGLLRPTGAGAALVPLLVVLADTNDAVAFGVLTEEERATLKALIPKMAHRHGLTETPVDCANPNPDPGQGPAPWRQNAWPLPRPAGPPRRTAAWPSPRTSAG